MTPSPTQLQLALAQELGGNIAPALGDTYRQAEAQLWALLCVLASQEAGRAADIRFKDIAEMRRLFGAFGALAKASLKPRLLAAQASGECNLDLASLDATRGALCTLLIAFQEDLELQDSAAAREALRQIWSHLQASAKRHEFILPLG